MPRVYQMSEIDSLDGNERIYATDDPTGTPTDGYVEIDTIAAYVGGGSSGDVTAASVGVLSNVGAMDSAVYEATVSSASAGLDITTYGVFDITLSNDAVLFVSDNPDSGVDVEWKVYVRGAFTPTFHNVLWAGGNAPTHDDSLSVYLFSTVDGGSTVLGFQAGSEFA